jgi:hypothetical protein
MAGLLSFLSDISVQAGGQPIIGGPLSKLAGGKYGLDNMRYPSDLASSDKNHYIQFTIYTQRKTSFIEDFVEAPGPIDGSLSTQEARNQAAKLGAIIVGAAGDLIGGVAGFIGGVAYGPDGKAVTKSLVNSATTEAKDIVRASGGSLRATQQISTTISLYMPDTVVFDDHQGYSDIQSGGELLTTIAAASGSVVDYALGNQTAGGTIKNLTPFILGALANKGGGFAKTLFSAATGVVVNPMLELIYSSPSFRTFRFDFMFYPRSTKEGQEVQKIIETLRFHQAPEAAKGSNGFFMVPPSEFGIKFYNNGTENPNIPTIAQCVMESLSVDYAPSGFSAYETVPPAAPKKGGTGMPVAIRVSMQFKETEIRTKNSHPRPGREGFADPIDPAVRNFINKLGSAGKIE